MLSDNTNSRGLAKRAGVLDGLVRGIARYKELLTGNGSRLLPYKMQQQFLSMGGEIDKMFGSRSAAGDTASAKLRLLLNTLKADSEAGSELRKVYATRAGTGIAGALGLKALFGGKGDSKKAEAAYLDGFCKAAEAAGVDPAALVKQAILTGRNAMKFLLSMRDASPGRVAPKISAIINRAQGVGRLSPSTAGTLEHMRDMATALDKYTVARAGHSWLGLPPNVMFTMPKGSKLLPQLVSDVAGTDPAISGAARRVLKLVGYIK